MAGSDHRERPGSWRPADVLVVVYALVAAVPLAWGALQGVPGSVKHLLGNLGAIAAAAVVVRVTRDARHVALHVLRVAYVPLLFIHFYTQIGAIWPILHATTFDAPLVAADEALFGFQPSLAFQQALPHRAVGELFSFAYYAYYFFNPVVLLSVLLVCGYARAERVLFSVTLCFYACYVFFWLVPTAGPHYFLLDWKGPTLYPGYVFNHLLFLFTAGGEIPAGAFPSSHIAVATLYTLEARRTVPRLFPFLAAITLLMLPGVVYLRAHYAVDMPAGLAVGLFFAWLGPRLHARLDPGAASRKAATAA